MINLVIYLNTLNLKNTQIKSISTEILNKIKNSLLIKITTMMFWKSKNREKSFNLIMELLLKSAINIIFNGETLGAFNYVRIKIKCSLLSLLANILETSNV